MAQDFIYAEDVILDPETRKSVAIIRNGEVFRDDKEGARIAMLVGAHLYALNGDLLGHLAAGGESLPISFKNLLEGKSARVMRAIVAQHTRRPTARSPQEAGQSVMADRIDVSEDVGSGRT